MIDIIRVWKDAAYRKSLTSAQLASVPGNPAGQIELSDTELTAVAGGRPRSDLTSLLQTCTQGADSCCC